MALVLASQTSTGNPVQPAETPPTFPSGLDHIGSYIPNAQLLKWCMSKQVEDGSLCIGFIEGVMNATGMIDVDFPRGPIDTTSADTATVTADARARVVAYLNALPNLRMSGPAARSVYDALVTRYPYQGPYRKALPYRPKSRAGE